MCQERRLVRNRIKNAVSEQLTLALERQVELNITNKNLLIKIRITKTF